IPIDFGSILTNSASGSCTRRAIDTALLSSTSSFGNSSRARAEAEYTLAPASLTIIYGILNLFFSITSAINCSVSLEAVPFPIAINSTSKSRTKFSTFSLHLQYHFLVVLDTSHQLHASYQFHQLLLTCILSGRRDRHRVLSVL